MTRRIAYTTLDPAQRHARYARCARGIRWRHRQDPRARFQALRELAARADHQALEDSVRPLAENPAERFRREVESALASSPERPVLRYSERVRLVARAMDLGLGRFEANLAIALAQNRSTPMGPAARREPVLPLVLAAAGLQAAIAAAAAWILL